MVRLGVSKRTQPSIMVGNIAGNYYALPMVNQEQQQSLLALLPPNASKTIDEEAHDCDKHPCDKLPDEVRLICLGRMLYHEFCLAPLDPEVPCKEDMHFLGAIIASRRFLQITVGLQRARAAALASCRLFDFDEQ